MGPFDVGEDGRPGIVTDPVRATINLWQGKATPGVGVMYEPGSAAWTQLNVTDPAEGEGVPWRVVRLERERHGWP